MGVGHGAQHVGGAAAGGDAHHQVPGAQMDALHVLPSGLGVVLRPLGGPEHGALSASHHSHHHTGVHRIGRGTLGGVQHAQAARGAAAAVDEPAAVPQGLIGGVHRPGDALQLPLHGQGHLFVLVVDPAHHLQGGNAVNVRGIGVTLLRGQHVQLYQSNLLAFLNGFPAQEPGALPCGRRSCPLGAGGRNTVCLSAGPDLCRPGGPPTGWSR